MAAAAAAAAAAGRTVRITSDYSEEEMTGNDESRTTEGESESERPTERPTERTERADRAVRKTMSEGMNTLREGDIKELASSESMPPEDAAQTWQNRWRRQSECMEDPDPEAQAEPEEIADAKCQESALPSPRTSMLDDRALGEGLELASEAKLVSIPQTEVPVLPAPGEARRPQDVHRESIGGPFEGTHSRHESFEEPYPTEELKEVPQLPTPVESTASSRRKTIVGVPGEVREVLSKDAKDKLVAMVTPVPSAVTVASVASVASVATVSPPEGPRIEARSEESQVSHLEPQKFASEPLPMETKPQSPERHLEEFQASSATSPSKESPKRSKMKSRSRSTSFNDAEEKRAIRADGLQELLQEVYDKFRRCSAQLREADLHGKIQAPGSNAGAEDTDLADTWQEVEWLRQAVVGMHSHLLLAQKRQNVLEKRCKDFQDKISEIRSQTGPAPDSTLLAPPRPEKEEKPRAVYASHVANIANVANVAVANVPCNSTPRGRGPVTTYVHPAQIRAASAPQVGLGRVAMPKSYASEVCLPSPRQVFQESPALRRQGPQAFVPVHSASPGKLPLTSRQMQFASMEGSPIFMPSPQSAAHASPAQGVRAWLSSPMPSISAPVTPVGTPVATPRVSPAPTPAPTPPVPGPGLPGLLYGSAPLAPTLMSSSQLTGSWSVPHPMRYPMPMPQMPPMPFSQSMLGIPIQGSSSGNQSLGRFGLSNSIS